VMSVMSQFVLLPVLVQVRAKRDACAAHDVADFYDLDPGVRRAVYEAAVKSYYGVR
jgi:hypothetical protein